MAYSTECSFLQYDVVDTKCFMFKNLMKETFTGENKDKYLFGSLGALKNCILTYCSLAVSLHAELNITEMSTICHSKRA